MQCIKLACVLLQLVRQILQNWQTVSPYCLCTRGGNHWWRLSCFVCVSFNLLTACLEEVVIGIDGMRRASGPGLGQRICGCHWNKATAIDFHFLHPSTPTLDLCTAVYKTRLCTFATCSADFAGLANSSTLSLLSLYRRMRSLMKAFLLCLFVLQLVNCVPRRYRYWSRWYAGQPTRIGSADLLAVFF